MQTIGFLSHLYSKKIYGPFMILGPLSTLSNWMAEFQRFCPTLKTVLYHGSKKDRAEIRSKRMKLGALSFDLCTFMMVIGLASKHSKSGGKD